MSKIQNKGKARIFKNPILEALTRTSPTIMLAFYIPMITFFLVINFYVGSLTTAPVIIGIFLLGILAWTFFEYVMHRYVLHFVNESKIVQRFHYVTHGVHHEFPRDAQKLFMPPIAAAFIITFYFFLFKLTIGDYVYVFLPGFMMGYLLYTFMHYSMHRFKPPKMLKSWWTHHALHHYKYPNKAFGVSSPLWDYVFRTLPPTEKEAPKAS